LTYYFTMAVRWHFSSKKLLQFLKYQEKTLLKASMSSAPKEESVIFESKNHKGIITLNKPKSLNAINYDMVTKILSKLEEWETTQQMVIIKGEGRAFCAGGDILSVTEGSKESVVKGKAFFKTEYVMNNTIGTYKIPYVALLDGITMGGGVGLSVHGRYRIATENTLFAMPETAIGLFPDVGGSYFLPRLSGKLGMFLALTGHRLKGQDCVLAGIATHFCPSQQIPALLEALIHLPSGVTLEQDVLNTFTTKAEGHMFSLSDKLPLIDDAFGKSSVEEIIDTLKKEGSPWSVKTCETLTKMSPTSLKLTKLLLDQGARMSLQQCLQIENRVAGHILEKKVTSDFYEGVRALLRDKDKNPKWSPASLEEVSLQKLQSLLEPLNESEELVI